MNGFDLELFIKYLTDFIKEIAQWIQSLMA